MILLCQGIYDVLMVERLISEAILHRYITPNLITYKRNLVPLDYSFKGKIHEEEV